MDRLLLPTQDAQRLLGDLDEEYTDFQRGQRARWRADLWYWRQILVSAWILRARGRRAPTDVRTMKTGGAGMESIVQDVRYTVRKLWTTPTFAVAAVLTLALGIGALGASQLLGSLLYGVTASDPSTYVGVVAILAAVGLAACYFPAREGSRVDPMTVLRTD